MKLRLLGLGLGFALSTVSPALALQPASVRANDSVAWSKVVENPFDGKVVYDRNSQGGSIIISSWAKSGIRATYLQKDSVPVAEQPSSGFGLGFGLGFGRGRGFGRGFGLFANTAVPVYQQSLVGSVPDSLNIAINGKVYTYTDGAVSPELSAALASAPSQNVKVRLVWKDGRTQDTEIGKGTVDAWKTIFRQ